MSRQPQPCLSVTQATFATILTLHSQTTGEDALPVPIVKSTGEPWTLWLVDTRVIGTSRGSIKPYVDKFEMLKGSPEVKIDLKDTYLYKGAFELDYIHSFLGNISKRLLEEKESELVKAIIYNLQLRPETIPKF